MFGWSKDTWIMQQSHEGLHKNFSNWDRLAIVVDKTKEPYQARFYQLPPGELKLNNLSESIPYKVRCYACHSNGPRAIRADFNSKQLNVSLKNKIQLQLWNIRIKTYGNIKSIGGKEFSEGVPFQSKMGLLSMNLNLKSCNPCHSVKGIRAPLKLEHLGTAEFLVKNKMMPPFPFQISDKDIEQIERYLK